MVDVLVSDIGMPGEDGYEFICQVRIRHAGRTRLPRARRGADGVRASR